jgi:hypothetical protein
MMRKASTVLVLIAGALIIAACTVGGDLNVGIGGPSISGGKGGDVQIGDSKTETATDKAGKSDENGKSVEHSKTGEGNKDDDSGKANDGATHAGYSGSDFIGTWVADIGSQGKRHRLVCKITHNSGNMYYASIDITSPFAAISKNERPQYEVTYSGITQNSDMEKFINKLPTKIPATYKKLGMMELDNGIIVSLEHKDAYMSFKYPENDKWNNIFFTRIKKR